MATKMANKQGRHLDTESINLKKLADSIILGSKRVDATLDLLNQFESQSGGKDMLMNYRDGDETLLHLATKFHEDSIVVESLISLCPKLLTMTRGGKYKGQTALHIAISKGNCEAVEVMVWHNEKHHLLTIPAIGSRFPHTVMMGELPLSVAAATCNYDIVLKLIDAGARMIAQNSYGDTVFHTLVKFSSLHSDKQEDIINMMKTLNDRLAKRSCEKIEEIQNIPFEETDPVAVWFLPNYEHLTPLQLAGKLGQIEIFNFILNIEDVYCRLDRHDGLFDIKLYDITEIDSVAMQKWFLDNRKMKTTSKIVPQNIYTDRVLEEVNKNQTRFNQLADPKDFQSVLERISKIEVQNAFEFLLLPVIRCIIKDKWSLYRWYYYAWALFHLAHMSIMTWYAIERTKLLNITSSQNSSQHSKVSQTSNSTSAKNFETFIDLFTNFNIVVSILYFLFECRRLLQKQYWHLAKIHHNGTYRVLLILFSLTVFTDAIWYKLQPGYDYLLIISVLVGCWFLTFFLRAFKKFSFFTVLIQKIIISDLFRFSIIIGLELLSFTAMIYLLFVNSWPPVEEFRSYRNSLLTLFNLMLGLSDISILNEAQDPWLAVGLFVTFTLLTYVLMINALIAMMSQTCALVSSNKHTQWQLQRLSIILFIENTVFPFMRTCSGQAKFVKHFDIKHKTMIQEKRYFLELDYLQTNYSKGEAILRRHDLAQTTRFDDVNALLSQFNKHSPSHKTLQNQYHGKHWSQDPSTPQNQYHGKHRSNDSSTPQNQYHGKHWSQDPSTPQNQYHVTQESQNICTPQEQYQDRPQLQHKYKIHKETDYVRGFRDSNKARELDEPPLHSESNIPNISHRRIKQDRMQAKPTHLKEVQQTKEPTNDELGSVMNTVQSKEPPEEVKFMVTKEPTNDEMVSVMNTVQSNEPPEEVKFMVTKVTQTPDPVISAKKSATILESQSEILRTPKEKGRKHNHRMKHSRSTEFSTDNRRTTSAGVSDKQDYYKYKRQRETTPTELSTELQGRDERGETPEMPQIDISKVYISS